VDQFDMLVPQPHVPCFVFARGAHPSDGTDDTFWSPVRMTAGEAVLEIKVVPGNAGRCGYDPKSVLDLNNTVIWLRAHDQIVW
jgi:hypothetical protein